MMKVNFMKSFFAAALALTLGVSASQAKDIVKQARDNDVASQYVLTDASLFYRVVNGKRCDITTNVDSFKISQHPNDLAMVYFEKNGNLYILRNGTSSSNCPKADTKVLMQNVKKYSVTSNTNTTIVNTAMSREGKFIAWDNVSPVLTVTGVDEYQMNQNFGAEGKPFSSYVAFVHSTYGGKVMKVKGINPSASKWDASRYYSSIRDFKVANGIDAFDSE